MLNIYPNPSRASRCAKPGLENCRSITRDCRVVFLDKYDGYNTEGEHPVVRKALKARIANGTGCGKFGGLSLWGVLCSVCSEQ